MIHRSFSGYKPSKRRDGLPYTGARIREAPDQPGPPPPESTLWTVIDELALSPLDTDPANPVFRAFDTNEAVIVNGWYDIVFVDADGDTDTPTAPISAYPASGFDATLVRSLGPGVDFAALGYALTDGEPDPLDALIPEAVSYVESVTGRVPLAAVPADWPGGAATYLPLARRAVALRVIQLAFTFTGDNMSAGASGVQSFSVPGYSEQKRVSSARFRPAPALTNEWDALWELLWLLMTPELREIWAAAQKGEDVPYFDIIDIDVPGAGLSDPELGIWQPGVWWP